MVAEALAGRETLASALDTIRDATRGPALQLGQAGVLADVLILLDHLARVERQGKITNGVPELKGALWRRYVAPALSATAGTPPLAPPRRGQLAGQWIDGRPSSVRVFDLWADVTAQTLSWSRDEFSAPMPEPDRVLARGIEDGDRPARTKLALYVDLSALPEADRQRLRTMQSRGDPSDLRYVLDETERRIARCLAGTNAGERKPDGTENVRKRPGGVGALIDVVPSVDDEARERCRKSSAPESLVGKAILFDPARRIRVLESALDSDAPPISRILARSAALAKAWP